MNNTKSEIRKITIDLAYIKTRLESVRTNCDKKVGTRTEQQVLYSILNITTTELDQIISVLGRTVDELEE